MRERGARAPRRWLLLGIAALALCVLPVVSVLPALGQSYSEEAVKAALLEKVVSFLEWNNPPAASRPFTLSVLGSDGLATQFERLFAERPFAGRRLIVKRVSRPSQAAGADIVVIGREQARELPNVLKACAREGVLLVGDGPGFADAGAAIDFFREGSRMRFEVRPRALKQAGIKASYKLLGLARIVGEP